MNPILDPKYQTILTQLNELSKNRDDWKKRAEHYEFKYLEKVSAEKWKQNCEIKKEKPS